MTSLAATAKREITQDWKTACLIIMWQAARTHTHTHANSAGYNYLVFSQHFVITVFVSYAPILYITHLSTMRVETFNTPIYSESN